MFTLKSQHTREKGTGEGEKCKSIIENNRKWKIFEFELEKVQPNQIYNILGK